MNKIINNRYEIKNKIGAGGMADVYLAHDTVLNREVAVKTLRGDLTNNPVALLRFKREANAGSGLNHPNIVEVYDVGECDGTQYIVMEYVKGSTAKELVFRRGGLETIEAVDFMLQLSYGISKAHSQGIIHRDIKPQNILIKPDGTLKVSDFGIAQAGDALQLTKVDSVMGSVHYLAPELVRGEGASYQSDIYAMGIIFYEILTGQVPFDGDMPVEIAMKQLKDPMPSVKDYNPTIPNSIVNIINSATHKNVSNRYKSVDEMIKDLQTALSDSRKNEAIKALVLEDQDTTKMIKKLEHVSKGQSHKKKLTAKTKTWIGVGVVSLVILFLALLTLIPPKTYILESLSGLTIEEAETLLAPYNIHIASKYQYEFSDEYESDLIIASSPEQGSEVEMGSQIHVVLSKGSFFEIGDYTGQQLDVIQGILREKTNITLRIIYEYDEDVAAGIILRQEGLEPKQKISPDQALDFLLVVSKDLQIQMPNLTNIPIAEAKAQLENQGIKVVMESIDLKDFSEQDLNNLSYGVVIKTNPMVASTYIQTEDNVVTLYFYDEDERPQFTEPPVVDETENDA